MNYKQVVVRRPDGEWSCWYLPVDDDPYTMPKEHNIIHGKSLRWVLRHAKRLAPGPVLYTYMEDFTNQH